MKNISLCFSLILSISIYGQTIDCTSIGAGIINIDEIECADDYLTFVVTTTGGNSRSATFNGLPPNSTFTYDMSFNNIFIDGLRFRVRDNENVYFNVPTSSCDPLPLNVTIFHAPAGAPERMCFDFISLDPNAIPIPTLGQWGLIVLAFGLSIVGIIQIRKKRTLIKDK